MADTPILHFASDSFRRQWNTLVGPERPPKRLIGRMLGYEIRQRAERIEGPSGRRLSTAQVNALRDRAEFDENLLLRWLNAEGVSDVAELTREQRARLDKAIGVYARTLFRLSEGGQDLSPQILRKSRKRMAALSICRGYPC